MKVFLTLLSFASAFILAYNFLKAVFLKHDYISRLKRYINVEEAWEEKKEYKKKDNAAVFREIVSKGIGKIKFLDGYKQRIRTNLARAHILLKAEEFITFSLLTFCLTFLLALLVMGSRAWPAALAVGLAGWFLPSWAVKSKIRKRVRLINEQLSDAITILSSSLKAGHSFFQAVDMAAEEMSGPISEEFLILKKEISLGLDTEKALENMAARISSDDMDILVTAVIIQRQSGGNLAELLDSIAATIRDRVKIKRDLKTITAQGRISGLIISILPFVLCGIIYLMNPSQMSLLFTTPLGQVMSVVALAMEITGIMLIRKIVRIEI
ncbi:MAG: type II secretion system F family protein [Bacillota bacterium]